MPLFFVELYFLHSESNFGKFRQRFLPANGSLDMYFLYNTLALLQITSLFA